MPFPRSAIERQQLEWFGAIQPFVAGASGAAPVPNCNNGENQLYTMSANLTVGAPLNPRMVGEELTLVFVQDAAGTRTLAWNAAYRNAPALAGGAATVGQRALVKFKWDGASWQFIGGAAAFA